MKPYQKQSSTPARPIFFSYCLHHVQAGSESLRQFLRAPFASLITLIVMGIAMSLPILLWLTLNNLQTLTQAWNADTEITLFLKNDVDASHAKQLMEQLKLRGDIAKAEYISPEQGLADLEQQSGASILTALGENPLPEVIVIYPAALQQSEQAIHTLYEQLKQLPEVDSAQFNWEWIKRFYGYIALGKQIVWILAGLLGIGVLLVVGNTIRLTTLNAQAEIEVIRLIGGSNAFIRRPFLYTGILYGLGGSVIALLVVSSVLVWLNPSIQQLANLYSTHYVLQGLSITEIVSLLMVASALGWMGSRFAISHYLNRSLTH